MNPNDRYDSLFQYYALALHTPISWQLLKAQAIVESSLNPNAISQAGAQGLTQFRSATWNMAIDRHWIPDRANPFNPEHSIQAQACYLSFLKEQFGELNKALAAYNWGPGNMRQILEHDNWRERLPGDVHDYIQKITATLMGMKAV